MPPPPPRMPPPPPPLNPRYPCPIDRPPPKECAPPNDRPPPEDRLPIPDGEDGREGGGAERVDGGGAERAEGGADGVGGDTCDRRLGGAVLVDGAGATGADGRPGGTALADGAERDRGGPGRVIVVEGSVAPRDRPAWLGVGRVISGRATERPVEVGRLAVGAGRPGDD